MSASLRNLLWMLACVLVAIASAVWSAFYPLGFALSYGPIDPPAQPEPATRAVADCEALEAMPRAKGARPGISNLALQPARRLPCGGLI